MLGLLISLACLMQARGLNRSATKHKSLDHRSRVGAVSSSIFSLGSQCAGGTWNKLLFSLEDQDMSGNAASSCIAEIFLNVAPESTKVDKVKSFAQATLDLYRNVPYHNRRHGFNVLQHTAFIIQNSILSDTLLDHEKFALLVAALCHDAGHPGIGAGSFRKIYSEKHDLIA
eukprot:jgi/Bigna1/145493/aug1.99_g20201